LKVIIRKRVGSIQLVKSQSLKRRLGGWCEMATSLGVSVEAISSVVRRWPAGNGVSVEVEESPLLESVTKKRLVDSVTD
jgi:hypothetical protein